MHLSDDELKTLWQRETQPQTRTACLSSELLVRAGEGGLTANEMTQVVHHIEQCSDCAEEYRLTVAVKDWATEAATTHADAFVTPASTPKAKDRWWRKLLLPSWRTPAFALAGIALLCVAWFVWYGVGNKELQPEIVSIPATPTPTPATTPLSTPSTTPEAPLIAQLQDGQRLITLNQQGELTGVDSLSPAQQQMIKAALMTQRIERSPMLAGLKRNGSALMSGSDEELKFAVIAPIGKVELTDRPTFRWAALPNATNYTVEIYDEQFNLVTSSPILTATTWTIPQPLNRGALYAWQVKAKKDEQTITSPRPPAPQAKFRVLSQVKANEIAQARRTVRTSPLMLGLLYAEAGLLDEAEAEFRALQQANPTSPVARRLLANVRALQR